MIFQHGIVNDYSIFKNPVFINDYCQRLINIDFSWGNKHWFLGHTSYWIHMDQSMFIPWYKRLQSMCNKGFFQQKMLLGISSGIYPCAKKLETKSVKNKTRQFSPILKWLECNASIPKQPFKDCI
jgi:hypothetical protein